MRSYIIKKNPACDCECPVCHSERRVCHSERSEESLRSSYEDYKNLLLNSTIKVALALP